MSARIALGFCNNVDYEIAWRSEVLQELASHHQIRAHELTTRGEIKSERDLVCSILGFMQAGAGGERFVANSGIIERFAARFDTIITLGGTSVRAAIAMRRLGVQSALHLITENEHVRRLIPADSAWVCSNAHDSQYPHLIVQYGAGDSVRAKDSDIRARQPNRLIYHCNADRIAMRINEDFADLAADARALLVSGFNAMQSERLLRQRLAAVQRIVKRAPRDATVYLEDGGYFNPAFRQVVYAALGRRLDVYGMNEDELQVAFGARGWTWATRRKCGLPWRSCGGGFQPEPWSCIRSIGRWLVAQARADTPKRCGRARRWRRRAFVTATTGRWTTIALSLRRRRDGRMRALRSLLSRGTWLARRCQPSSRATLRLSGSAMPLSAVSWLRWHDVRALGFVRLDARKKCENFATEKVGRRGDTCVARLSSVLALMNGASHRPARTHETVTR